MILLRKINGVTVVYHDILSLDLGLFLGKLLKLHFGTEKMRAKQTKNLSNIQSKNIVMQFNIYFIVPEMFSILVLGWMQFLQSIQTQKFARRCLIILV